MTIAIVLGFILFITGFLFFYQRKMMYFPRRYQPVETRGLPAGAVRVEYTTSQGKQVAFYVPPNADAGTDGNTGDDTGVDTGSAAAPRAPARLWVLFHGNASTALDWLDLVDKARAGAAGAAGDSTVAARQGFLLIDYPGYGDCEGKPTRAGILESTDAAFAALATRLGATTGDLESDLNVLAYSIGTGAGLDFAARRPVRRVFLLAPFTSTLDMARRTVGWPLCHLLLDRFDNRARLAELTRRSDPPAIDIFHGTADDIVPFEMGRTLADEFHAIAAFHPVPNADHNFLLMAVDAQLAALLLETPDAREEKTRAGSPDLR